jgi:hypothetical protein
MSAFQRFSVSAFSVTTLRAGQFAGRCLSGPRSTDCIFVLPATCAEIGKTETIPRFQKYKCRKQKAETSFSFRNFRFLSALHPKSLRPIPEFFC